MYYSLVFLFRFTAGTAVKKVTRATMSPGSNAWIVGPTTQFVVDRKSCLWWPQTSCIATRGNASMEVVGDRSGDLEVDAAGREKVIVSFKPIEIFVFSFNLHT